MKFPEVPVPNGKESYNARFYADRALVAERALSRLDGISNAEEYWKARRNAAEAAVLGMSIEQRNSLEQVGREHYLEFIESICRRIEAEGHV